MPFTPRPSSKSLMFIKREAEDIDIDTEFSAMRDGSGYTQSSFTCERFIGHKNKMLLRCRAEPEFSDSLNNSIQGIFILMGSDRLERVLVL